MVRRGMALVRVLVVLSLVVGFSSSLGYSGLAQSDPTTEETQQPPPGGPEESNETPVTVDGDEPVMVVVDETEDELPPSEAETPPDDGEAGSDPVEEPAPEETEESVEPTVAVEETQETEEPAQAEPTEDTATDEGAAVETPAETSVQDDTVEANDFQAAAVGTITVVKINCDETLLTIPDAEDVLAGTVDLGALGCSLAGGVDITATDPLTGLEVGSATTVAGVATLGLVTTSGAEVTVTEDVPVGFTPQNGPSQTFVLDTLDLNVRLFVNVADDVLPETSLITVIKLNCDVAIDLDGLNLEALALGGPIIDPELLEAGCELANDVDFTVTEAISGTTLDTGATGITGIVQFEVTTDETQVTVTEDVPLGFTSQNGPSQTFTLADTNIRLFVNVAADIPLVSALVLVKLNCEAAIDPTDVDIEAVILGGIGVEGDLADLGCTVATGVDFTVSAPIIGTIGTVTTVNGVATLAAVPVDTLITIDEATQIGYTPQVAEPRDVTIPEGEESFSQLFINIEDDTSDGTITVTTENTAGDPLGGACYDIVDSSDTIVRSGCDVDGDGEIVFEGLEPGTYDVVQTTAPGGYALADPVETTITVGDPDQEVTVVNDEGIATVTVTTENEAGDLLPGACYEVQTTDGTAVGSACDTNDDGVTVIEDLEPGDYVLVQTTPPAGYAPADDEPIEILPTDPTFEITIVNDTGAGSVTITTENGDGDPLGGACYEVRDGADVVASACDNGAGDEDDTVGTTVIDGLLPGTYTVVQTTAPGGYALVDDPQTIEITVADPTDEVTFVNDTGTGTITIETQDADGDPLGNACYTAEDEDGTVFGPVCDTDGDGTTVITGLEPGIYDVVQTTPPPGYDAETIAPVTLTPADPNETIEVVNDNGAGSVVINTEDGDGTPLPGACYNVVDTDGDTVGSACDIDDGTDDGETTVDDLPPGEYTAVQTTPPGGYDPADPEPFEITPADLEAEIDVTNDEGAGQVTIETEDADGNPLPGACYNVLNAADEIVASECDGEQGPNDGTTVIGNLIPGTYTVVQTTPPVGFDPEPEQEFTLTPADPDDIVTFVNDDPAGSITVTTVGPDGTPLTGACYNVLDSEGAVVGSACDGTGNPNDGTVVIDDLPIGDYTLVQTTPPATFEAADPIPFSVTPTELDLSVTVVNGDAPGAVVVFTEDGDGEPLEDACYRVVTAGGSTIGAACDDDDGDSDGETTIDNLPLGDYTLVQVTPPPGYVMADDTPVELTVEDPIDEVTVVNDEAIGSVTITTEDEDGNPLLGACYNVVNAAQNVAGSGCDGIGNANDGEVTIGNLPPGEYTVVQTTPPGGYDAEPNATAEITVEDPNDEVTFVNDDGAGVVTVITEDEDGDPLPGACYNVLNSEGDVIGTACDDDDGDNDGTTTIPNLPPGDHTLEQTTPPPGFDPEPDQDVTLDPADPNETVTVVNDDPAGSITITTKAPDGGELDGACYEVRDSAGATVATACDPDGDDGDSTIVIDDLPLGDYTLVQTTAPEGFDPADDLPFSIEPEDVDIEVTVVNESGDGSVTIDTVDADGDPLVGACYEVQTTGGDVVGEACDDDDGDNDGTTTIENLPLGEYTVVQVTPPAGYEPAADRSIELTVEDPDAELTVVNGQASGSVTVITRDEDGDPIPGACYAVQTPGGSVIGEACDEDDGDNDGETTIPNLPPGDYEVDQTTPPPGYDPEDETEIEITPENPDPVIDVINDDGIGSAIISTVDDEGNALPGACYLIRTDGGTVIGEACDGDDGDNDGTTTIEDLTPGDHLLEQTEAPEGYAPADDQEFSADPDEDVELTVVNSDDDGNGEDSGSVAIEIVDEDGDPLLGVCLRIEFMNQISAAAVDDEICDGDDGSNDGQIVVDDLPLGDYVIIVTDVPAGYDLPDDIDFSITEPGQTNNVTIVVSSDDDGDGDGDGDGDDEEPTKLPDTGAGATGAAGNSANLLLLTLLGLGSAAAGFGLRERRRARLS